MDAAQLPINKGGNPMYKSLQNLNSSKQHIHRREIKMSKVLRFVLLVLLSILYPTTESKSAFQRATENDVKFHKPPSKNHVPLAYQKIGAVFANHIDGHLHISLPIKPFNDSIAMEEKHYEEGKKRISISLDNNQPCLAL